MQNALARPTSTWFVALDRRRRTGAARHASCCHAGMDLHTGLSSRHLHRMPSCQAGRACLAMLSSRHAPPAHTRHSKAPVQVLDPASTASPAPAKPPPRPGPAPRHAARCACVAARPWGVATVRARRASAMTARVRTSIQPVLARSCSMLPRAPMTRCVTLHVLARSAKPSRMPASAHSCNTAICLSAREDLQHAAHARDTPQARHVLRTTTRTPQQDTRMS